VNCKQGDLAVVVMVDGHPVLERFIGSIRRVKIIVTAWDGPAWTYEGRRFKAKGQTCQAIPDRWLRPIRDPGDGAIDQSKAWLPPVPTRRKVPA
jgi:hypothetical protein